MKLVMTLLVRDEEDILCENIEYHLSQGVDFIIATDNCSVDSTKEILKKYEKDGKLLYIYEGNDNYSQYEWVTRMARIAFLDYGADWVINNDADEFWWPNSKVSFFELLSNKFNYTEKKQKTLKDIFESLPSKYNILQAERINFVCTGPENKKDKFFQTMVYRESVSVNSLGKPLPPKQAHIGSKDVIVNPGNHSVNGINRQKISKGKVEILHFPIRSHKQLLNKIIKGGEAYTRNTKNTKEVGATWRNLYADYIKNGNLDEYLQNQSYDKDKLMSALENKELVVDSRLNKYLSDLFF